MKKISLISTLICCVCSVFCQSKNDTTAIKQLLEKESATWRSGDTKGHADCWHIQPYSKILVSTGDGRVLDIPPTAMINSPATAMGNGGTSINTDYKMNINGVNAWVSHHEVSTAKDGKKSFSDEIRILEKIDGNWKLVGQSIHIYQSK